MPRDAACQTGVCVPANGNPRRQQVMAQVAGSLPPLWETQIKFLLLGFGLGQPRGCAYVGSEHQLGTSMCLLSF